MHKIKFIELFACHKLCIWKILLKKYVQVIIGWKQVFFIPTQRWIEDFYIDYGPFKKNNLINTVCSPEFKLNIQNLDVGQVSFAYKTQCEFMNIFKCIWWVMLYSASVV